MFDTFAANNISQDAKNAKFINFGDGLINMIWSTWSTKKGCRPGKEPNSNPVRSTIFGNDCWPRADKNPPGISCSGQLTCRLNSSWHKHNIKTDCWPPKNDSVEATKGYQLNDPGFYKFFINDYRNLYDYYLEVYRSIILKPDHMELFDNFIKPRLEILSRKNNSLYKVINHNLEIGTLHFKFAKQTESSNGGRKFKSKSRKHKKSCKRRTRYRHKSQKRR